MKSKWMILVMSMTLSSLAFADDIARDDAFAVKESEFKISMLKNELSMARSMIYNYNNGEYQQRVQFAQNKAKINGSFWRNMVHGNVTNSQYRSNQSYSDAKSAERASVEFHNSWATDIDNIFQKTNSTEQWFDLEMDRLNEVLQHKQVLLEMETSFNNIIRTMDWETLKKARDTLAYFFNGDAVLRGLTTGTSDATSRDLKYEINQITTLQKSLFESLKSGSLTREAIALERKSLSLETPLTIGACKELF